ncbi:MAG: hypothetical protein J7L79_01515 [Thaumarchaeota archaeon]|nr:hypothetical protein [Nitrososphaerota archaeon]
MERVEVRIRGNDWEVEDIVAEGFKCVRWENETDIAFSDVAEPEKVADLVVDVVGHDNLLVARGSKKFKPSYFYFYFYVFGITEYVSEHNSLYIGQTPILSMRSGVVGRVIIAREWSRMETSEILQSLEIGVRVLKTRALTWEHKKYVIEIVKDLLEAI